MDLLDPHNPQLPDATEKAVGLARYAQQHGDYFGRVELIVRGKTGEMKRLDVNNEANREKVLPVKDMAHLEAVFDAKA